ILRNAIHTACTDRLDARLLDCLEHCARLLARRLQAAMHRRVMTGKTQRDGIGMTAHNSGFRLAKLARRLWENDFSAHEAGALGGECNLKVRLTRERANAAGDRALERLGRRLFLPWMTPAVCG